jgi:hypothetical protein
MTITKAPISLVHPGPVRLVRRGARKETVALTEMRTPAVLREADPSDLSEVGAIYSPGGRNTYHAFEGGLWLRVRGNRPDRLPNDAGVDAVVAFLEGRRPAAHYHERDYVRALVGSPLLGPLSRGVRAHDENALEGARSIGEDLRAEAVETAGRWIRERLLVAGGNVYVRSPNPMVVFGDREAMRSPHQCRVEPFPAFWRISQVRDPVFREVSTELQGFPVRMDRMQEMEDLMRSLKVLAAMVDTSGSDFDAVARTIARERERHVTGLAGGIPRELLDDDDLILMANVLPGFALDEIRRIQKGPEAIVESGEVLAAKERLGRWETRGAASLIGIEAAEAAIGDTAALAKAYPGVRLPVVAAWSEIVALPRLRERNARMMPAEDEGTLATLAP